MIGSLLIICVPPVFYGAISEGWSVTWNPATGRIYGRDGLVGGGRALPQRSA